MNAAYCVNCIIATLRLTADDDDVDNNSNRSDRRKIVQKCVKKSLLWQMEKIVNSIRRKASYKSTKSVMCGRMKQTNRWSMASRTIGRGAKGIVRKRLFCRNHHCEKVHLVVCDEGFARALGINNVFFFQFSLLSSELEQRYGSHSWHTHPQSRTILLGNSCVRTRIRNEVFCAVIQWKIWKK